MILKRYLFFTALTFVLAACSSDPVDPTPNFPADGVIRVTAGLDAPISRAGLEVGDLTCFNLRITTRNEPNYSYYALMKKEGEVFNSYVSSTASTDPADSKSPLTMLWKDKTTAITVTALALTEVAGEDEPDKYSIINTPLYFFEQENTGFIGTDQSTIPYLNKNDIIYMEPTPFTSSKLNANGQLELTLSHRFSKVKVEMTFDKEFGEKPELGKGEITNVQVHGTNIEYSFTPSTNTLTLPEPTSDNMLPITPLCSSFPAAGTVTTGAAVYECIVLPQSLSPDKFPFKISFKIRNKSYVWSLKSTDDLKVFAEGLSYLIPLKVGKDVVTLGTITADPWGLGNGTGGDITVK